MVLSLVRSVLRGCLCACFLVGRGNVLCRFCGWSLTNLVAWPVRYNAAADIVAHRLKAVEYCAVRGGRWENGQDMELITPDGRGSVSTPATLETIVPREKGSPN